MNLDPDFSIIFVKKYCQIILYENELTHAFLYNGKSFIFLEILFQFSYLEKEFLKISYHYFL